MGNKFGQRMNFDGIFESKIRKEMSFAGASESKLTKKTRVAGASDSKFTDKLSFAGTVLRLQEKVPTKVRVNKSSIVNEYRPYHL